MFVTIHQTLLCVWLYFLHLFLNLIFKHLILRIKISDLLLNDESLIVATSNTGISELNFIDNGIDFKSSWNDKLNNLGINSKLVIIRHHKFSKDDYLNWLEEIVKESQRVLKDNGNLYMFASAEMSWYVEGVDGTIPK